MQADEIPEGGCITSQVMRIKDSSLENASIEEEGRGSKIKTGQEDDRDKRTDRRNYSY